MSVLFVLARFDGDGTAGFRDRAAYVLELHGGVRDREPLLEHTVETAQNRVAGRGRNVFDQHVTAQRMRAGTQAPDVQIVNVEHALNAAHGRAHIPQTQAAR